MGALKAIDSHIPRPVSYLSGVRPGPSKASPGDFNVQQNSRRTGFVTLSQGPPGFSHKMGLKEISQEYCEDLLTDVTIVNNMY